MGTLVTALVTHAVWINRKVANTFFEEVRKIRPDLQKLQQSQNTHDQASADAHKEAAKAQKAICKSLTRVCAVLAEPNGKNGANKKGAD